MRWRCSHGWFRIIILFQDFFYSMSLFCVYITAISYVEYLCLWRTQLRCNYFIALGNMWNLYMIAVCGSWLYLKKVWNKDASSLLFMCAYKNLKAKGMFKGSCYMTKSTEEVGCMKRGHVAFVRTAKWSRNKTEKHNDSLVLQQQPVFARINTKH